MYGEAGDVRRFKDKRTFAAYAGVDPGRNDSGKKVSTSGKISRSGDTLLRKAAFQVVDCYLKTKPEGDA
ncbi:MAG: IS110 family transposase, partial [Oscillospiraceae bacterium]|nr:IS110 family transposase [Oscillospiraceae bacterium]